MLPDWCLSGSGRTKEDQAHQFADGTQCEVVGERLTDIGRLVDTTIPWILYRIDDSTSAIDPAKFSCLAAPRLCQDRIDGYICFHPTLQSVNQVTSMTQLYERNSGVPLMSADQSIAHTTTVLGCDEHRVLDQRLLHPHHHGEEDNSMNTVQSAQSAEERTQAHLPNLGGTWTMVDWGEEGRVWEREEKCSDQTPSEVIKKD